MKEFDRQQFSLPTTRHASAITRFAIKQNPEEVFNSSGKPEMYMLDSEISALMVERLCGTFPKDKLTAFDSEKAEIYLFQAIRQYIEVVAPDFANYDELLHFVDDPRTHQAIAFLALRAEDDLTQLAAHNEKYVEENGTPLWGKAEDGDYLKIFGATLPESPFRKCPYAGHRAPVERIALNPMFAQFCRWTGRLAIFSYEHHGAIMPGYTPGLINSNK